MTLLIGDRFRNTTGIVWEITHIDGMLCTQTLVDGGSTGYCHVGLSIKNSVHSWIAKNSIWEYIGNFNKQSNFDTLYELFSQDI